MEMDRQQLKAIIDRYLEGKASPAEQAFIAKWLNEEDSEGADLSNIPWEQLGTDMLSNIRQEAGYKTPDFPGEEKRGIRPWAVLRRIAAILVLGAGIFAAFQYLRSLSVNPPRQEYPVIVSRVPPLKYRSVSSDKTGIQSFTLPDGSVMTLNRNSRARFPEQFKNRREVYLEAGEAFFDVKTDAGHPFIVYTKQLQTSVLGTSFNVRTHGAKITVMVKTGSVKVSTPVTASGPAREVVLTPNLAMEVDTGSYISRPYTTPAWISTAWCATRLEFQQNTLPDIARALENRFRAQIRLRMPSPHNYRYTASFTAANTLTEILDALCLVHQLKYERKGNKINIYAENNTAHE